MRFTKMQGAGNDFVMLNATQEPFTLTTEQIRALCDRRYGVGCDQLLVVEKVLCPKLTSSTAFSTAAAVKSKCAAMARVALLFLCENLG